MKHAIPPVRDYMSTFPHAIGPDQPLKQAHSFMASHSIRHLPVLQRGVLLGVVHLHDVQVLETLEDLNSGDLRVEHAMRKRPYAVAPETPLDEVVETMAARKLDCAVVVNHQQVVGIFTNVDLSRACVALLRATKHPADEHQARP